MEKKNHVVIKITLWVSVFLLAIAASLLTTYLYGALFAHDRYWSGTVQRVNYNQTILIKRTIQNDVMEMLSKERYEVLSQVFETMDRKLSLTISKDGEVVFTNKVQAWELGETLESFHKNHGDHRYDFVIADYEPPSWSRIYGGWLQNISGWFDSNRDFVTFPFIFFSIIWFLAISALLWRFKADLESRKVTDLLDSYKDTNEE